MANLITKKLAKLPIGTYVELAYDSTSHETVSGTITDSDFSENIQVTAPSGEELILSLSSERT